MSEGSDDVKRVLAICFRTGATQTADDVERILSFDMGWMDTETAHNAIKALIFAGWIKDEGGVLSPNCDIRGREWKNALLSSFPNNRGSNCKRYIEEQSVK